MKIATLAAVAVVVLGIGSVRAEPAAYSLTGMGTGVAGTSKCATYQISIDVTVDGKAVKGVFKQQGRPERAFAAILDDKGEFKTKADVGEGNVMDVHGTISDKESRILLDGYCKFEGKLDRRS